MVKKCCRRAAIINIIFFLHCFCLLTGCKVDFLGFFGSSDLDDRLKERDNFRFLSPDDRTLSLGEEFSFIVLCDTHIEGGNIHGLVKLKDVIDSDSEIKFVVFNGDIAQHGKQQNIETFIKIAKSLSVPCYPVIGNHDVYFGNWSVWKNLIGSTRYRINGGGVTLFILDSANAYFGKDQLNWLEKELKNTANRVFIFSHVNLFVKSPVSIQQFTDIRERARFVSLLQNRCDAMFMGHSHMRDERETGGIRFITVEDYQTHRIYCRVSVKKTGISREFKKL